MTKVLFLIPNLAHGGAEKVLVNLANNMDKTKFDVTVQTLFDVVRTRNLDRLSVFFRYHTGIVERFQYGYHRRYCQYAPPHRDGRQRNHHQG